VILLHAATQLANYLQRFDILTEVALDRERSREFIHTITRDL
jgi:hypothetical protein